ncbi:MAG: insulinase family protein [Altererythrobacter sp.]|nr:insulinase family protein [Altererythrobacter sp.]
MTVASVIGILLPVLFMGFIVYWVLVRRTASRGVMQRRLGSAEGYAGMPFCDNFGERVRLVGLEALLACLRDPSPEPRGFAQERGADIAGWLVVAHFLEHMAFNGSRNVPEGEVIKLFELAASLSKGGPWVEDRRAHISPYDPER